LTKCSTRNDQTSDKVFYDKSQDNKKQYLDAYLFGIAFFEVNYLIKEN